jgi:hypothetical protein
MRRSRILPAPIIFLAVWLLAIVSPQSTSSQTCCLVPSTESTSVAGQELVTETQFNQMLSDNAGDSFDALTVEEGSNGAGTNSCWWSGSGLEQNPTVSGGTWVVGGGQVQGQHNHWGYDVVGYYSNTVLAIRQNGPGHNVTLPCTITIKQAMSIECADATTFFNYTNDVLTQTIYTDHVVNRRANVCNTIWQ